MREHEKPVAPQMYPLDGHDRALLLANQGFRCAICGVKAKLVVDHDHQTGFVRGGLCEQCNYGLGNFRDNQRSLMAAIGYLAKAQLIREDMNVRDIVSTMYD